MALKPLRDCVGVSQLCPDTLPICHTARLSDAQAIAQLCSIGTTSKCPQDLGRPAAYFFYGLPVYEINHPPVQGRLGTETTFLDIQRGLPIVFLLRLEGIQADCDIYPFDTGAIRRGLYEPSLLRTCDVADFQLQGKASMLAPRLVGHMFGTNESYVRGIPKEPSEFQLGTACRAVAQVYRLPDADERRMTIELVTHNAVSLEQSLMACFVPDKWRDHESVLAIKSLLNVEMIGFPCRVINSGRMVQSCADSVAAYMAKLRGL